MPGVMCYGCSGGFCAKSIHLPPASEEIGTKVTMPVQTDVSKHYTHVSLIEAIRAGIGSIGKAADTVAVHDLSPVDEFHIGGRRAFEEFLDQLGFSAQMHILDVGCGLGGAARFVASRYGSRVTGIDLTAEYVETGNTLCKWVGLDQCISVQQGSALAMPFAERSFDGAYMLHVGMNIEDKEKLASEVARVLQPHSRVYRHRRAKQVRLCPCLLRGPA
jgi:SAM-dependent methyltransferase